MAIEFVCPSCQSGLRVSDDSAGQVVRCCSCLATVRVPAAPPPPSASTPTDDAAATPPLPSSDAPSRPSAQPVAPPTGERPRGRPIRRRRPPPPPTTGRGCGCWILVALLVGGLLIVLACGGIVALLQPKWHTHHSDDGKFQVDLPAPIRDGGVPFAPLDTVPDFDLEGTILPLHGEQYGVMWGDIDSDLREDENDEEILTTTIAEILDNNPGARKLSEKPVVVSGCPGREVVFSQPGGYTVCRIVVVDTKMYIIFMHSQEQREGSPRLVKFMDSFQITDPQLLARAAARRQKEIRKPRDPFREMLTEGATEAAELIDEEIETVRNKALARGVAQSSEMVGELIAATAEQVRMSILPVAPPPRPKKL